MAQYRVISSQGVDAMPQDNNSGRLWAGGRTRRIMTGQVAFGASTTTPFSGGTPAGVIVYDSVLGYNSSPTGSAAGETDADSPTGLELVISNNASGQTLSGITLEDYDTLPSGVTVPGQSYTTATNVATGASVTLSSLSLANNTAVRLWIPVSNAAARMWVVNPTYAAAVTIGTGNFEVRATPTYGSYQLSGGLPAGSATVGAVNEQRQNGSAWEPVYNNMSGTLLASAARTASLYSPVQTNYNARGVVIGVNVTAISGTTPSLVLQLALNDPATLSGYSLASAAITATGIYYFVMYPATLTAPNGSIGAVELPLPREWLMYFSIAGTTPSVTFSATYDYVN